MSDTTRPQEATQPGSPQAAEELLPLVYGELRQLARQKMAREAPGQTLQATALVHEAWLRVAGTANPRFGDRAHFFAAAAEAMRRILIDRARRRKALRHGGGQRPLDLEGIEIEAPATDDELLAVHDALERLAAVDPLKAEVVKLRFFIGLTNEKTAQVLGLSEPTVKRSWAHARAWLYREIHGTGRGGSVWTGPDGEGD